MKETLFKKEFSDYRTVIHQESSPIESYNNLYQPSSRHPLFLTDKTSKIEDDFEKNYANPLAQVHRIKMLLVVEKEEKKISIKFFQNFKYRNVGKSWFKTIKHVFYLTVNTESGDIYHGNLMNYQRKKKFSKTLQKNFFLSPPVSTFKVKVKNSLSLFEPASSLDFFEALRIFADSFLGVKESNNRDLNQEIFEFYLKKKGIKYPNNFILFAPFMFGGKIRKKLKKNNFKLVDSFMEVHNLKGDKIKKALHTCEDNINTNMFNFATQFFPYDWLCEDNMFMKKIFSCTKGIGQYETLNVSSENFTKGELKNIFSIFVQVIDNNIDSMSFLDHLRIYGNLKSYGETDLKWKSSNKKEFNTEHLDWSDKWEHYRKGNYERIYPEYFTKYINKPISYKSETYYPVLLSKSTEYNSESFFQHNCVKTYIGRPSAIIISMRKGSPESEERATIEYYTFLQNNKIVGIKRVQTRGKYNSHLEPDWDEALIELDGRMEDLIRDEKFKTVKLRKVCLNGTILESETEWDKGGNLIWSFKSDLDTLYNDFMFYI